jgi:putative transcriptional regulator
MFYLINKIFNFVFDKQSCHAYNRIRTYDKYSCHIANINCQEYPMPLYNRLKEHRVKINVNQFEMGQLVGVSRQTISLIERGDYSPSITLALKIAKILGVTVEDIFSYEEDQQDEQ